MIKTIKCPGCDKLISKDETTATCNDCRGVWPLAFIHKKHPECAVMSIGNLHDAVINATVEMTKANETVAYLEACSVVLETTSTLIAMIEARAHAEAKKRAGMA